MLSMTLAAVTIFEIFVHSFFVKMYPIFFLSNFNVPNFCQFFCKMKKRRIIPLLLILLQTSIEGFYYWASIYRAGVTFSMLKQTEKIWIFSFLYLFWAFAESSFMDPGTIGQTDYENSQEFDDGNEKLYCPECKIHRPPRSHHCKTCGRCIALKDHHCFYIGNCAGSRNYRSFILFLISFLFHSFLSILLTYRKIIPSSLPILARLSSLVLLLYSMIFGFSVVKQLIMQIKFLRKNITWIEFSKTKAKYSKLETTQQFSRYDTGSLYLNLKQRLGPIPLLWLIPIPNNTKQDSFPQNPNYIPWNELDSLKDEHFSEDEDSTKPQMRLPMT